MNSQERDRLIELLIESRKSSIEDVSQKLTCSKLTTEILKPCLDIIIEVFDYTLERILDNPTDYPMNKDFFRILLASDAVGYIEENTFPDIQGGFEFIVINPDRFLAMMLRLICYDHF